MTVAMTHKMEDDGFPIDVIHADNDSTTIMKLKMDFKDIKKKDDQMSGVTVSHQLSLKKKYYKKKTSIILFC